VIFVTTNELAVMYQLWSCLSEKSLLEGQQVVPAHLSRRH
jgi:hypothetical protein